IAGTYFLRVDGGTLYKYDIVIDAGVADSTSAAVADSTENNQDAATAYDLRTVEGTVVLDGLAVSSAEDEDWFRFTTTATGIAESSVRIDFVHDRGDLELELLQSDGVTSAVVSSTTSDYEQISLSSLPAGDYFIRVIGFNGDTNPAYRLTINTPETVIPRDRFEVRGNDALVLNGNETLSDLTIHAGDQDFFYFSLEHAGTAADRLVIDLLEGRGDLIVTVRDSAGMASTGAAGSSGHFVMPLDGMAPGTFSVFVYGLDVQDSNRYQITLQGPHSQAETAAVADWTIMVYMTAGNLEEFAKQDLNELETAVAGLPASVNVLVMLDQSSGIVPDIGGRTRPAVSFSTGVGSGFESWGSTGFGVVQGDRDESRISTRFDVSDSVTGGERNSGDPDTLVDFVNWGAAAAPAEHYALVM
ncbi:MAG: pre-peptidase C-terminal domain-containing protein, partial [Planctomycetaceae bacterium]|nr:pre-peptidase C-terminal domain-containing protein [Planctomycetaceae bacterium]